MNHLEQVQRAIDHIESHLTAELSIDDIAREAAFSRWHFQMVFTATVGETVKSYIRRRRLSIARISLCTSDKRIIDIAFEAGFESQESFSRAYKILFGHMPGESRKLGAENSLSLGKPKITMEYLLHLYKGVTMEPKFMNLSEFSIIGLDTKFVSILSPEKNNHIVIPKLWDLYFSREAEITGRTDQNNWGVCAPLDKSQRTQPDECFYMAGTSVEQNSLPPSKMLKFQVPSGRYAVFTNIGKLDQLEHTMNYIYGAWLHQSGQKLREAPDLEFYDARFKPDSDQSQFDIYIPIM